MLKIIDNALQNKNRLAIISNDKNFYYKDLISKSENIATYLLNGSLDLNEQRIAFLVHPSFDYVSIQWGIWRAGGIAVPLCVKHPLNSIQYVIDNAEVSSLIYSSEFEIIISKIEKKEKLVKINLNQIPFKKSSLPEIDINRRAMILYTSGTTGNPKGVVTTHLNIEAQIKTLVNAWCWKKKDHIVNVLPLHHVHGIINVVSCSLWSGACCEFIEKFEPHELFNIFLKKQVNVFMAVPTIYYKLIQHWNSLKEKEKEKIGCALKDFRLMVSGSAALPISVMSQWEKISSHKLLERYGMTEIGMAISNPYKGTRKPGHIGNSLPGVNVKLLNDYLKEDSSGEIHIKGINVFKEYWNNPKTTKDSFTSDGWFKTGDIAVYDNNSYRILGRNSVDIIKSGGYKISALEIEEILRTNSKIKDCAVVGIPDEEWGELIVASLVVNDRSSFQVEELKKWLKDKLPVYQLPRKYIFQKDLPRNVMGKVTKNELKKMFN